MILLVEASTRDSMRRRGVRGVVSGGGRLTYFISSLMIPEISLDLKHSFLLGLWRWDMVRQPRYKCKATSKRSRHFPGLE